jgi:hypothetical protein
MIRNSLTEMKGATAKNTLSYTSTPPYICMTLFIVKKTGNNFTFKFYLSMRFQHLSAFIMFLVFFLFYFIFFKGGSELSENLFKFSCPTNNPHECRNHYIKSGGLYLDGLLDQGWAGGPGHKIT